MLPTPCSLMRNLGQAEEHHRDRGPTRLSLSCSFVPVAPPVFLVVMLELLHGVPLAIASSSLLLPISRGSVSHRQTLHQRPHEVQKARRLPLIEEFARQSACAATDVYAVCAVWRFQTSMSPFSDCGVHPPEQLARLQTLKQPLLVRGEPLRKLRSIAPTLRAIVYPLFEAASFFVLRHCFGGGIISGRGCKDPG